MLLTTLNNVGSKTLFNAVFNRPEQVVRFWLCRGRFYERWIALSTRYSNLFQRSQKDINLKSIDIKDVKGARKKVTSKMLKAQEKM